MALEIVLLLQGSNRCICVCVAILFLGYMVLFEV